ncbi:hypothetical protein [Aliirhizobium smilacinae]|uniref:Uncharacterized protein n=1 Tax=Aliirhizobium smilacinae TaxID=1395944 RepID=A0A5C4XSC2_9HYPH|nr:hypothetical protein [Rhizobium smilacinae]TNM66203.1 hypothetical protein FHP24_08340 [Rhizobium smilacinae]
MQIPGMSEDLQTIRDIGWSLWDPIGLNTHNGPPAEAIDEYDSYLLEAIAMLRDGRPLQDVIATLVDIESEHMALGESPDSEERATQTVLELRQIILNP